MTLEYGIAEMNFSRLPLGHGPSMAEFNIIDMDVRHALM